jgi:hypothetical protein
MPPRHTYWTILFGDKPTAFRSATQEELLPTFKQIQGKHPDAVMMWFARGKLWRSEEEARAIFDRPRGPRDLRPDPRGPRPEWKDRPPSDRPPGPKPEWRDRPKPAWQNRGPKPPAAVHRPDRGGYGEAAPKPRSGEGGEWRDKPQGDRPHGPKPDWRDRPQGDRPKPAWQNRGPKPAWRDRPQGDRPPRPQGNGPAGERPVSKGPDKRGRDWRPGGAHEDPRDRFKVPRDVKRARFKQNLQRERTNPRPPRKKKDEE